jgi:hypothetical protein
MEDKIFALSLLKHSPRAYKLLKKTFALPSRKTLMALLNKVPFGCGVNKKILESLHQTVKKKETLDRYCCLAFDEMSLEPSLTYNKKEDAIDGFIDCGSGKKKEFADHAMVFMARGLKQKWKQPIAYFFTSAGMSAADIARNVKNIIGELQRVGLNVIATVCDQSTSNCSAVNMLLQETKRNHLIKGKENRMLGFSVGGEEVIPLFDVPHMLKGIRNNLLERDAKFNWKEPVEQIASWRDIITAYELDTGDFDTRMMCKLTDQHVYPEKMKKMKVKLAAQVFSQRVSSTMRGLIKFGE